MLNSAEVSVAHRKAYTIVDKCFIWFHKCNFWMRHPIFAWNLHYGKQPTLPYIVNRELGIYDPDISYKVLSNKYHVVAFFHREYPGISYVPDVITPSTNAKVHREMTAFFKHYAALDAARDSDYIMDDVKKRGKTYRSNNY